ncbi:MAG: YbjQ family protein [Ancalomicrobiaceae bacterium]|nr:YbjQ family protein [Ancalomicrobiaceae bacterium]
MLRSDFVTTGLEFQTYRIVREMGVAHGIVVRSRSVIGNFFGSIQTIFGGNITVYTQLCEQARAEAFEKMLADAGTLGANGIIGFRFASTELGQGLSEVLAYGTAVLLEPKR